MYMRHRRWRHQWRCAIFDFSEYGEQVFWRSNDFN